MPIIDDIDELLTEARCFRVRQYYLAVGVVCAMFCIIMGVGSIVAALWNIDGSFPHPKRAALIFGVFWSAFLLLAIWIIAAYFRERLFLTDSSVVQYGVFSSKRIEFRDVLSVKWRLRPIGGSVVVRTESHKVTIQFDNFSKDDRAELIQFLHETFREESQENWESFNDFFCQSSPSARRLSRRDIVVISILLMCIAGAFIYCWLDGHGSQFLYIGLLNAVASIWYLSSARTTKESTVFEDVDPHR